MTVLVGEGTAMGPSNLRAMSSGDVVPSCCVQLEDGGVSTTGEGTTTELSSMNLISLMSIDITESKAKPVGLLTFSSRELGRWGRSANMAGGAIGSTTVVVEGDRGVEAAKGCAHK